MIEAFSVHSCGSCFFALAGVVPLAVCGFVWLSDSYVLAQAQASAASRAAVHWKRMSILLGVWGSDRTRSG